MAIHYLAFLGFSPQDILLLRSLMNLSEPLLKEKWELVEFDQAEVILVDIIVHTTEQQRADLANANIIMVYPAGTELNHQLALSRPLRVSHLVAVLNKISTGTILNHEKASNAFSASTNKAGFVSAINNWLTKTFKNNKPQQPAFKAKENLTNQALSLRIFAPPPRTFHNPALELNERQIAKSLEQLSLLNLNFSVPFLMDAIQGLSDEPLSAQSRFQLLELYRESINNLFRGLGTPILRNFLPLGDWEDSPFDPGKLFVAFANGYKAVILALIQEKNFSEALSIALWRALEQLSQTIIHAYRYYRAVPSALFLETHQIFNYAKSLNMENYPLRVNYSLINIDAVEKITNITNLYKIILLITLTNPYSLSVDYLNQILIYLIPIANKVQLFTWQDALDNQIISESVPIANKEGLFIVDYEMDQPPFTVNQINFQNDNKSILVVDTKLILETIYNITNKLTEKNEELIIDKLPRRLVEQLITYLRGAAQRTQSRYPGKSAILLAVGIAELHQTLLGKQLLQNESLTVINENSKGLMISAPDQYLIKIGEIVGIKHSSKESSWLLGVIRWLRVVNAGGITFGIEIITGSAEAIWYSTTDQNLQIGILQNLIEENEQSLITVKGFYRRGLNFKLKHKEQLRTVTAGHLIQEEPEFDQFEIT